MTKIKMLTQDNCPKCIALKSFLELGLRNKYQDDIEVVKREEQADAFMDLVQKHKIMATPVLIAGDAVLADTSPSKVAEFLKEHI
ncbi:glutaredoxin [Erysipelothrix sp. HDW6A]|uniref:glutaredoxin family protein n=1 Tax=Erysipelothrix sp. HDW6A TaxID=2714928 RepID=UPI0014099E3B|nr:glutaredoxin [Erysipelothrix sp. HDW6A]QIK57138.1 glutaredoxin [Erysipelothrix sp. HDW6A]